MVDAKKTRRNTNAKSKCSRQVNKGKDKERILFINSTPYSYYYYNYYYSLQINIHEKGVPMAALVLNSDNTMLKV